MKNLLKILLITIIGISVASIVNSVTLLTVPQGGTGAGTFTSNSILKGNGTGALQSTGVLIDSSNNITPSSSDGSQLGTSSLMFSDLFLASGSVVNWNAGDVTVTHSSNTLSFAGASSGYRFDAAVIPAANGGSSLGAAVSGEWANLYLTQGGTVNWDNGDITLTQADDLLTLAGGGFTTGADVTVGNNLVINTGLLVGNNSSSSGILRLFEDTDNGANFASFQTAASLAANTVYTLPPDDGDAGEHLQTDGSGTLTWEAAASGAVNVSGTPADNQVAVWTNANTIEGDTGFTFDATTDNVTVGGQAIIVGKAMANDGDEIISNQANFIVSTDADTGDYTDIQSALNNLPTAGGVIFVKPGTYTLTSGITIADSEISIIGSGNSTIIAFDGTTVPTAISNSGTTQRTELYFKDFIIKETGAAGDGTCLNFTYFATSIFENVNTRDCKYGYRADATGTHYNTIISPTIIAEGVGSAGITISNSAIFNTVINPRIRSSGTDYTGIYIDAHAFRCIACNVEADALVGIKLGSAANDAGLDVYLEGNQTNLELASGIENITVTGFIADADTAAQNIVDNGAKSVSVEARVQYDPAFYISNFGNTNDIFTLKNNQSTTTTYLNLEGTGAFSGSSPAIVWENSAGVLNTARIRSAPGSSYTASEFSIDVADSAKVLQERFEIDVTGLVTLGTLTSSADVTVGDEAFINVGIYPDINDGATIGSTGLQWSDLFLAEGGVINWDGGDATITQANNAITFGGIDTFALGSSTAVTLGTLVSTADVTVGNNLIVNTALYPDTSDGATIGNDANQWSDIFLAEGGVINWDNGDATITQTNNVLAIAGITNLQPSVDDEWALGGASNQVSDIFLASGSVVNWASSDVLFTHTANTITMTGGNLSLSGGRFINLVNTGVTALRTGNNNDSASVPVAIFEGDRATMADNDEGYIQYMLSNDAGTQTEFGRFTWVATDVNAGTSVDGRLDIGVTTAGTLADELQLDGTALSPSTTDGLSLGTSSLNFSDLFLDSGAVVDFDGGDVVLTHSANTLTLTGGSLDVSAGTLTMATIAGAIDAGAATSFEIPNGTGGTVNADGEITLDTTDDQIVYYGADAASHVLSDELDFSFAVATPSNGAIFNLFKARNAITVSDIHCITVNGTSVVIDIYEADSTGASGATLDATITCDSNGAEDDGSLTNGTIDAGDWVQLYISSVTGGVSSVSGSAYYTNDRQ